MSHGDWFRASLQRVSIQNTLYLLALSGGRSWTRITDPRRVTALPAEYRNGWADSGGARVPVGGVGQFPDAAQRLDLDRMGVVDGHLDNANGPVRQQPDQPALTRHNSPTEQPSKPLSEELGANWPGTCRTASCSCPA